MVYLGSPTPLPLFLLLKAHTTSLLNQISSLSAAFLSPYPMVLTSHTSWALHTFNFHSFIQWSHSTLFRDSKPFTHCLASAALWNHGASPHDLLSVSNSHAHQTRTTLPTLPSLVAISRWSLDPVNYSCTSICVLILVKHFLKR